MSSLLLPNDFNDGTYSIRTEIPANQAADAKLTLGPYRLPQEQGGQSARGITIWVADGVEASVRLLAAADQSDDFYAVIAQTPVLDVGGMLRSTNVPGDWVKIEITPGPDSGGVGSTAIPVIIRAETKE